MTYATRQDMVDRFGEAELVQLTDRNGSAGAIVDGVLDRALADADATIDGYLRAGGYDVPLEPAPSVLGRLAPDLARYYLYDDAQASENAPWVVRYRDAIRTLQAIRDGRVSLGLAADGAGRPAVSAPPRVFTRDDLEDF